MNDVADNRRPEGFRARGVARLLTLFVAGLLVACSAAVAGVEPAQGEAGGEVDVGAYCGIHSLYAAMRMEGRRVPLRDLVRPEYISTGDGSTLADLKRAAEANGLNGLPMGNLTTASLRASAHPVILHVMGSAKRPRYDHWIAYLGTRDGMAWVYDSPRPATLVPFAELAAKWDGTGLVVAAGPVDAGALGRPARQTVVCVAAFTVLAVCVAWYVRRGSTAQVERSAARAFARSGRQGLALAAAALVTGTGYHLLAAEGMLARRTAPTPVGEAYAGSWLTRVDAAAVRRALAAPRPPVLVDARFRHDYEAGHVPGAISLPVDSDLEFLRASLAGVDRSTPIVVYCQSAGCDFDETIATMIQREGYSQVQIFHDGWTGWTAGVEAQAPLPEAR